MNDVPSIMFLMVGEMYAHVQGVSLKAYITDVLRFFELPDHQSASAAWKERKADG